MQVSAGGTGICAITGDPSSHQSQTVGQANSLDSDSQSMRAADQLLCWGNARHKVNATAFEQWDQVSVGAIMVCGVSMDSDLTCFGGDILPAHIRDYHKYIVVA